MSEKIFKDFTVDLNENFLKEFDKITEKVKKLDFIASIFKEMLIDTPKLNYFFEKDNLLFFHNIDKNDLVSGFKIMVDRHYQDINFLKENKENE
jgi:hypothetical protein